MIYKFDKNDLEFKKIKLFNLGTKIVISFVTLVAILSFVSLSPTELSKIETEKEMVVIFNKKNEFSRDKLIDALKRLNVKFPYIVYAQAELETGGFTSRVFRENNNLFGMKEAKSRISTASGTQYNHAFYETWMESVYDYAFYSSSYLRKIQNEADYFEYLSQSYAEDSRYVTSLKRIIKEQDLKSKF
jgi:uncharacterized FlgJ-related protein